MKKIIVALLILAVLCIVGIWFAKFSQDEKSVDLMSTEEPSQKSSDADNSTFEVSDNSSIDTLGPSISKLSGIEGRWQAYNRYPPKGFENYYYAFEPDGRFTFFVSDSLTLNTVERISGRYECNDSAIFLIPERYLEKSYNGLKYDSVKKDWIFVGDDAEWVDLDSMVVSECFFSTTGDTIYIDFAPYIKVTR